MSYFTSNPLCCVNVWCMCYRMFRNKMFIYKICLLVDLCVSQGLSTYFNTDMYLHTQLEYINKELNSKTKIWKRFANEKDLDTIVFNNSKTTLLSYSYTAANIFSLFNETYVLLGTEIYQIRLDSNNFQINRTLEFTEIIRNGSFLQVAEYHDLAMLLVPLTNGISHIYGGNRNSMTWNLIQSIQSRKSILDASFFTNSNGLYLFIASTSNPHDNAIVSVLKWNGAYFDEIDNIYTKNPSSIISFKDQHSSFIMFLEDSLNIIVQRNIVIYELNENLRKVQLLRANGVDRIVTYTYGNVQYVALFSREQNSTLFWWDDSEAELLLWKKFEPFEQIQKILTTKINGIPLFFVVDKGKLLVFVHSAHNINLIHESNSFEHHKTILDMKIIQDNITNALLIFTYSCDKLSYVVMPFIINSSEMSIQIQNNIELLECLRDLEKDVQGLKKTLGNMNPAIQPNSEENSPRNNYETVILGLQKNITSQNAIFSQHKTEYQDHASWLTESLNNIHNKLEKLNEEVDYVYKPGDEINGQTIIHGELHAEELVVKNLQVKYINNKPWMPHTWLSYTRPQTITGQVYMNQLSATNIDIALENQLSDILFSTGNQTITGKFAVQTLTANNIKAKEINGINFVEIYLQSKAGVIQGMKILSNISADAIYSNQDELSKNPHLYPNNHSYVLNLNHSLNVGNIYVEEINNINWNQFVETVFRVGVDRQITGKLSIKNSVMANYLYAKYISNMDIGALLTTSTNQMLTSKIEFGNLLVPNVHCNSINNISLDEIVNSNNRFIKGPVSINNLEALRNVFINASEDNLKLKDKGDHIIGTNESDLLQIYNKHVKIHGNLYIPNILVAKTGKVLINNKRFTTEDLDNYWLRSTNQVIPVHVEPKKGISTSHLTTKSINDIAVDNYFNSLEDKLFTNIIFENITVSGNVNINTTSINRPNLQLLDLESVKSSGSFTITGQKTLQGILGIGDLIASSLDEVDLLDVVTTQFKNTFTGSKKFDTIIIKGNILAKNISTELLNNVNLKEFKKTVLYLDEPHNLDSFLLSDLIVGNFDISTINNVNVFQYVEYLDHVYAMTDLTELIVNGNVSIGNAEDVTYINYYDVNNILNKVLDCEHNIPIKNAVRFLGNIHAGNLEVNTVNNVYFPDLVSRLFYRSWTQNISVPYTFDKIITTNMITPQINNVPTKTLVNTKETKLQNLLVWGGLKIAYPKFMKSVAAERLSCNIPQAVYTLKSPHTRFWGLLRVSQNVTFWDESSDIAHIFNNIVYVGKNSVIISQVIFEHDISTKTLKTQNLVNGIAFSEIINDAIVKNVEDIQVISGYKVFKSLTVVNAIINLHADIPIVNNISIENLNQSIIYKTNLNSVTIKGMKTFFGGLQTERLLTSTISNTISNNLVSCSNLKIIPEAYFHSLEIANNLKVDFVNNISVPYVIQERMLCCVTEEQLLQGNYYLENATIVGNSIIPLLNKMSTDDIVFNDEDVQKITSEKVFSQNLILHKNTAIVSFNGEDLSECYRQSIHFGETSILRGNVILTNASLITANLETDYLNGVSMKYIQDHINLKIPISKSTIVYDIINDINGIIKLCSNLSNEMSKKFIYLAKSTELQIAVPNALHTHALQVKDNVIFHITQSIQGFHCGLPTTCACTTQHTVQISEQGSINTISAGDIKRVFSYENEDISSHLFTNSSSYNSVCRNNAAIPPQDEPTVLMWMTHSTNNTPSSYFFTELSVTGYVSGVEYFTFHNNTYMVICRFYDPINDTYDLDCQVYKFVKNKGKVILIQVIKTTMAWTIHIFPTAQGIILIIGGFNFYGNSNKNVGAGIYRFNTTSELFMPLRRIFNTISLTSSAILNSNSLIIFAEHKTIEILKYHPKFDNYYHYQNILLDLPISGISTFYSGDFGVSDVHLCVVTDDGVLYIYSYQYVQGWKLISKADIDGLRLLVPFTINHKLYVFAVSTKHTFLLSANVHGLN